MAPHSSTLAWKIPWMEEPGSLQSTGSLRVRQDWATSLWLFTFMHWRRKWQPTPVFLPRESQGWGAWWASIYGVAQSRTRLKRLSSSSSSSAYLSEFSIFKMWWLSFKYELLSVSIFQFTHSVLYFSQSREQVNYLKIWCKYWWRYLFGIRTVITYRQTKKWAILL